ncbi:putative transmembrane protein 19 [Coleophoma crateriformis]|uniref:Putative transmembrane protein 19 n=1 Tax=Coleophoma crateriformis TaxID=565419 RepID=A0A3D8T2K4_9HELO|nr:putative transmembrane protein 19 [Coleophoma crateriformis]
MKAIIAGPITLLMVYRAWSHKSLTPAGIFAATLTAIAHAVHPWNLPFALLIIFFLAGTRVTKVKHDVKAKLTISAGGSPGGEGARTHVQVFANSAVASVLSLLHTYQLHQRDASCYPWAKDLLIVGIVANYAAVAADTFSSELGILSKSPPRLITSLNLRKVPPGTNGGVTLFGLAAGLLGSIIIVTASMAFIPFCSPALGSAVGWTFKDRQRFTLAMTLWGALGSVLDSFLGGWLQTSVVDTHTGKIIEGDGGRRVLVSGMGPNSMHYKKEAEIQAQLLHGEGKAAVEKTNIGMTGQDKLANEHPGRVIESGSGLLDNNEVNFLMAFTMSLGAMGIASWAWGVPIQSVFGY